MDITPSHEAMKSLISSFIWTRTTTAALVVVEIVRDVSGMRKATQARGLVLRIPKDACIGSTLVKRTYRIHDKPGVLISGILTGFCHSHGLLAPRTP